MSKFLKPSALQLQELEITGNAGSSLIPAGQHIVIVDSAEQTESQDKSGRFKEKTPQLKFVFKDADGRSITLWPNLIGYVHREDTADLEALVAEISKDADALKSLRISATEFKKLPTVAQQIERAFDFIAVDEQDEEKGEYAIFRGSGFRIPSEKNTRTARNIIGRMAYHAGLVEKDQTMTLADMMSDIVGREIGIEVANIGRNGGTRVKRTMLAEDVVVE